MLCGLAAASMDANERSTDESMDELAALVETAGGEVAGALLQQRAAPDPRSFIGGGKVAELKELIANADCDLAVFDNELTPSQMRVLGEELGVRVLDRSGLILDIFAQRARTREGKLQVELAQYEYLLPRLTGMWTHLVRQTASGGSSPIGTRGPGETQLETDRRHIRRRIQKLRDELEQVRKVRSVQRRRRERNAMPVVAIVETVTFRIAEGVKLHFGSIAKVGFTEELADDGAGEAAADQKTERLLPQACHAVPSSLEPVFLHG